MAIVNGTGLATAHYNGAWLSYTDINSTVTGRGYGGGPYYFILKISLPATSGATDNKKLTFKLGMVGNLNTSGTLKYALCTEGRGETYVSPVVPSGSKRICSGSFDYSGLTYQASTVTVTTDNFTRTNSAQTIYLWVYEGNAAEFYGSTTHFAATLTYTATTECTAPTAISISPSVFPSSLKISWSGAKSGVNNKINGYLIQRSLSADNKTWGSWATVKTAAATESSYNYSPTMSAGYYVKFRIRAEGSAGASFYSDFKESTTARKAPEKCLAPVRITTDKYFEDSITVNWSGAAAGEGNPIKSYKIERATSTNGATWGAWVLVADVATKSTSGNRKIAVSVERGAYIKFRIRTEGEAGASYFSGFRECAVARRNILASGTVAKVSELIFSNLLTVSWSGVKHSTGGIKGYNIDVKKGVAAFVRWTTINTTSASGTAKYTITSPKAGEKMQFRVTPIDIFSMAGSIGLTEVAVGNTAPTVPTVFAIDNTNPSAWDIVKATWSGATDVDKNITAYEISLNKKVIATINTTLGSGFYDFSVGHAVPENTSVDLSISTVDKCGYKSAAKTIKITRIDNSLAVGIGDVFKTGKIFLGKDNKWKQAVLFFGENAKWKRISAKAVAASATKTYTYTGQKIEIATDYSGTEIKGFFYAAFLNNTYVHIYFEHYGIRIDRDIVFNVGMEGLMVESGENYIDTKGNKWLCDVYDLSTKTLTKYVAEGKALSNPKVISCSDLGYPPSIKTLGGLTTVCCDFGEFKLEIKGRV